MLIDSLAELGIAAGRLREYPGVWVDADGPEPRKIARDRGAAAPRAHDARLRAQRRPRHGLPPPPHRALRHRRPSGDVAARGARIRPAGRVARRRRRRRRSPRRARWSNGEIERQDVAWKHRPDDLSAFSRGMGPGEPVRLTSRLASAGVTAGIAIESRKPEWLRPKVHHGPEVLTLKRLIRSLDLVTVCEDAGCPNLSECWSDGTATFMALGERCTRACGFCLVDTHKPEAPASDEPERIASAVVADVARPRRRDDGRPRRPGRRRHGAHGCRGAGDPVGQAGRSGRDVDLRRQG
ncbi:MAG: hypothetical protein WKF58_10775 [Ilumatobacteraceae bacterium]